MRLLHYTKEPFQFDANRVYTREHWKPQGLWVSVEGERDWPAWCEGEQWNLASLRHVSEVTLRPAANVLMIDTAPKLDAFHALYSAGRDPHSVKAVDWEWVKAEYGGVIIAPFQLEQWINYMWYYGWDCASGVIWNLSAIERVAECELSCG